MSWLIYRRLSIRIEWLSGYCSPFWALIWVRHFQATSSYVISESIRSRPFFHYLIHCLDHLYIPNYSWLYHSLSWFLILSFLISHFDVTGFGKYASISVISGEEHGLIQRKRPSVMICRWWLRILSSRRTLKSKDRIGCLYSRQSLAWQSCLQLYSSNEIFTHFSHQI